MRSRVLIAFCLTALISCTTQTQHTVLGPTLHLSAAQSGQQQERSCPRTIAVIDKSVKSYPLSDLDERAVQSIAEALLTDSGSEIVDENSAAELNVTINRAYILSLTTSNSAVVVLSVAHAGSDSPTIYRGRSVGVNWWGTLREYEADIKEALKEALKPLKAELQQVCSVSLQN